MPLKKYNKEHKNQYDIQYKKDNFDRISFVMPKGEKEIIKATAAKCGMSAGEFIRQAIQEKLDKIGEKTMEEKAINYVLEQLGLTDSARDDVTINTGRNGRDVAWYLDDTKELCVYVDTLEELTPEEIKNELM